LRFQDGASAAVNINGSVRPIRQADTVVLAAVILCIQLLSSFTIAIGSSGSILEPTTHRLRASIHHAANDLTRLKGFRVVVLKEHETHSTPCASRSDRVDHVVDRRLRWKRRHADATDFRKTEELPGKGGEQSFVMTRLGMTRIHCAIHPNMTGILIVREH
jgi:hypothetical protein